MWSTEIGYGGTRARRGWRLAVVLFNLVTTYDKVLCVCVTTYDNVLRTVPVAAALSLARALSLLRRVAATLDMKSHAPLDTKRRVRGASRSGRTRQREGRGRVRQSWRTCCLRAS
eukprot:3911094-Rhodomonas_salina.1